MEQVCVTPHIPVVIFWKYTEARSLHQEGIGFGESSRLGTLLCQFTYEPEECLRICMPLKGVVKLQALSSTYGNERKMSPITYLG